MKYFFHSVSSFALVCLREIALYVVTELRTEENSWVKLPCYLRVVNSFTEVCELHYFMIKLVRIRKEIFL